MAIDETLACEQVQTLCIACWTITKEEQLPYSDEVINTIAKHEVYTF
jgi:hypothetical protein